MGLVPKFDMRSIDSFMEQAEQEQTRKIIRVLKFVGEKAVNEAKANGSYKDQTANLRNSIGFVISVDGKILHEDFEITATGTVPSEENPIKMGKTLAYEIASKQRGISLIVVSGMKYGLYVEATKRNVLTSAEQLANVQVPRFLKELR